MKNRTVREQEELEKRMKMVAVLDKMSKVIDRICSELIVCNYYWTG